MPAGPLGGRCNTKVCTSSWVAYWVRYGLILRMLYSAKRHDLETEAMWAVKVRWSSIMTSRFLAVLDGARDKESVLILMFWWMTCWLGRSSVPFWPGSAEGGDFSYMWIYQRDSAKSVPRPWCPQEGNTETVEYHRHNSGRKNHASG